MSWKNDPRIRDLEPYAKKHGLEYVVLFGLQNGGNQYNITTYGRDRRLCDVAHIAGDQLHGLIQRGVWPKWDNVDEPPKNATPKIVVLCGSGRFREAYERAEAKETLAGHIVLTIGVNTKDIARDPALSGMKPFLDKLHLRKIDLADEVFVLNVGGYVGESTANEIAYAEKTQKPVRYLESISRQDENEEPLR